MPMNSSGPISLGGATVGESINLEIGQPATSTVSLNDTIVRTLAGVSTGQIVVPTDFYGKSLSNSFFQVITTGQPSLNNVELSFDKSGTGYYVFANRTIVKLNSDNTINYSRLYTFPTGTSGNRVTAALSWVQSNFDPSKLLMAGNGLFFPPLPAGGPSGVVLKVNDSDGTLTNDIYYRRTQPGSPVGQPFTAIGDFPNGRIIINVATGHPGGRGANLLSLNSDLSFNNCLRQSNGPVGATAGQLLYFSPTRMDTALGNSSGDPISNNMVMGSINNSSGISLYLDSNNVFSPSNTAPVSNIKIGGQTPSTMVAMRNQNFPSRLVVYKMNTSGSPVFTTRFIDGTPTGTTTQGINQGYAISTNERTGPFFTISARSVVNANPGPSFANQNVFIELNGSSGAVNRAFDVSNNAIVTSIQYKDGNVWLAGFIDTNKAFVLKTPENLNSLTSGLTATTGGSTITLTLSTNPVYTTSPLSSSFSGYGMSGDPYGGSGANTSPVTSITPGIATQSTINI